MAIVRSHIGFCLPSKPTILWAEHTHWQHEVSKIHANTTCAIPMQDHDDAQKPFFASVPRALCCHTSAHCREVTTVKELFWSMVSRAIFAVPLSYAVDTTKAQCNDPHQCKFLTSLQVQKRIAANSRAIVPNSPCTYLVLSSCFFVAFSRKLNWHNWIAQTFVASVLLAKHLPDKSWKHQTAPISKIQIVQEMIGYPTSVWVAQGHSNDPNKAQCGL